MTDHEFQEQAARTECDQRRSLERMNDDPASPSHLVPIRANHAVIGLMGEVGELAQLMEKWIYYGRGIDPIKLQEEIGDCLWYIAQLCNTLHFDMESIKTRTIAKLRVRYPECFKEEQGSRENRDLEKEREVFSLSRDSQPIPLRSPETHPSHQWNSILANARCQLCGAYANLSSGFRACPSVGVDQRLGVGEVVDGSVAKATLEEMSKRNIESVNRAMENQVIQEAGDAPPEHWEQNGHGWAEPPLEES